MNDTINYITTNTVELECTMVWSTLEEILCTSENPGVQQSRHSTTLKSDLNLLNTFKIKPISWAYLRGKVKTLKVILFLKITRFLLFMTQGSNLDTHRFDQKMNNNYITRFKFFLSLYSPLDTHPHSLYIRNLLKCSTH